MDAPTAVQITIHSARDLYDTNFVGRMDPYVAVTVGKNTSKTKCHSNGGTNPRWEDTLTFTYSNEEVFNFRAFDKDTFSSDDYIGCSDFLVRHIAASHQQFTGDVPLSRDKGKPAGYLSVTIRFYGSLVTNSSPGLQNGTQPSSQPTPTIPSAPNGTSFMFAQGAYPSHVVGMEAPQPQWIPGQSTSGNPGMQVPQGSIQVMAPMMMSPGQMHIMPQGQMHMMPQGQMHMMPQGQMQMMPQGQMQMIPQGHMQMLPPGQMQMMPQGQMQMMPQGQMQMMPQGQMQMMPQGQMQMMPQGQMQMMPQGQMQMMPQGQMQMMPQGQMQMMPQGQMQMMPQGQMQMMPTQGCQATSAQPVTSNPSKGL